jgi:hypothetical protein
LRARVHRFSLFSLVASGSLAAIAAACSLTTSLTGFSGGANDDATKSDAPNVVDGMETSTDGGPLPDGADGAVATPFRCSDHPAAVLCSDFEGPSLTAGWNNTLTSNGGVLESGNGRFGRGLSSRIPAWSGAVAATRPNAALETSLPLAPRQPLTLSFDTIIQPGTNTGAADFMGILFHGAYYIVAFRMDDDGKVRLLQYADPTQMMPELVTSAPLLVQPAIGTWVHVVMQLTFPAGRSAHLTITFDGTPAFDGDVAAGAYASQPYVNVGLHGAGSAGQGRTLLVDDVLVTTP